MGRSLEEPLLQFTVTYIPPFVRSSVRSFIRRSLVEIMDTSWPNAMLRSISCICRRLCICALRCVYLSISSAAHHPTRLPPLSTSLLSPATAVLACAGWAGGLSFEARARGHGAFGSPGGGHQHVLSYPQHHSNPGWAAAQGANCPAIIRTTGDLAFTPSANIGASNHARWGWGCRQTALCCPPRW